MTAALTSGLSELRSRSRSLGLSLPRKVEVICVGTRALSLELAASRSAGCPSVKPLPLRAFEGVRALKQNFSRGSTGHGSQGGLSSREVSRG